MTPCPQARLYHFLESVHDAPVIYIKKRQLFLWGGGNERVYHTLQNLSCVTELKNKQTHTWKRAVVMMYECPIFICSQFFCRSALICQRVYSCAHMFTYPGGFLHCFWQRTAEC